MTIRDYVMDTLLAHDLNNFEWVGRAAEKWEISKDKKVFTFHLRKGLKFHDGQPLTADDVKFSFDALFDSRYRSAHLRNYFQDIDKVEVLDPLTIRFTSKDAHYQDFAFIAAGLQILPKAIYSDLDKSEKLSRSLIGSGPYRFEQFEKGKFLILVRNENWYGFQTPEWKGFYNFSKLTFHFVHDENLAVELMKSGDLDFLEIKSRSNQALKTDTPPWGQTLFKIKAENSIPKDYLFLGMNQHRDFFKDKNVRMALALLTNRAELNRRFRSEQSDLTTGPQYSHSDFASATVKPISFDPEKAKELLAKAGWKDNDKKGILQKKSGGKIQEFRFVMLHSAKDLEKYWSVIKDDFRKAGIDMEVRFVDWNNLLKTLDAGNFDAFGLAWNGVVDWDPKALWASTSVPPKGSNFLGYKNSEVDKLIEKARLEFDRSKRTLLLKKTYEIIAQDVPAIFLFNDASTIYLRSANVKNSGDTMKYDLGTDAWWSAKP